MTTFFYGQKVARIYTEGKRKGEIFKIGTVTAVGKDFCMIMFEGNSKQKRVLVTELKAI